MQKGFKKTDSVVSLFSGWSINDIAWYSPLPQHEVIRGWLEHFFSYGTTQATLILDPIVAADVAANGYPTKEAFAKWLAEKTGHARLVVLVAKPERAGAGEKGSGTLRRLAETGRGRGGSCFPL